MKWIGQHIYDLVSRFREDVYIEENDFYMYNPTTVGNPTIRMGANEDEMLQIKAAYQSGTQSMQVARFTTFTESGTANDGKFQFWPDSVRVLDIDDGGIDFQPNTGISINGTDILTDSSGTATLSNIDALDATTIATFETAMEANLDTFGSQMTSASALATVGTIGTGTWQGTAIASAYLDHDTAHLSTTQTFTGAKTFTINPVVFGGNRTLTPGDGAFIHQDTAIITDGNTSEDGTAAIFSAVNIEGARLAATNSSVTTTAAASLYIKDAPTAGTNQTITNAYALWVDDGLVKFDGALTVGGTITGDVTGDLTGQADTVATIAGLAPNTATTQASQPNITGVGTIGTGVWNGTAIGGNYIAATQPNIESIGTDGDTLAILADQLHMSNATADTPVIKLVNTTDDDQAGQLVFEKLRDDNGVSVGQNLGEIWFRGQDGGTNTQDYAYIVGEIDVSGHGQESGKLILGVANHDGGNGNGLILTGGSADNEIDVTVGLGTASVTTVAGDLTVTNDLTVNGDTTTFSSANADDPTVIIENTRADIQGARLQMKKDRGAAMVQGDRVGEIDFIGEDAGENFAQYGKILVRADVVTEDQESGKMMFQVANHDSGLETGLTLVGGSEDGEIDATLGLGANSITTVAGTLTMGSTASMGNTGLLTVGAQTGITAAANLVTVGTIGTGVWEGTAVATDQQKHLMHYQAIGFSAGDDTNYEISKAINQTTAPFEHTISTGSDGLDAQTIQIWARSGGHVMPNTCTLKRWRGWAASNGSSTTYVALFKVTLEDDVDSDPEAVLLTEMSYTASGNGTANSFNVTTASSGGTLNITAGDIVFTAMKGPGSNMYFNSTFEVEF